MKKPPKLLGSTERWSGRLSFRSPQSVNVIQSAIADYVSDSGITVVGYLANRQRDLTLLRWPETRPGYRCPKVDECHVALYGLAEQLQVPNKDIKEHVLGSYQLHALIGRRRDGYNGGRIVPLGEIMHRLGGHCVIQAHMVSARTLETPEGREVIPYNEPALVLGAAPSDEGIIHHAADIMQQHHYAIEHGPMDGIPGWTDLWQTRWAPEV